MKKRLLGYPGRILAALALVLLAVGCASARAAETSGTFGDNLHWEVSDSGVLTISGTGAMVENTYKPWQHYELDPIIKKVVVKQGVTHICSYAFYSMSALEEATIADSVTTMGDEIFLQCHELKSVKMPSGLTSLGERVFERCEKLQAIEIPDGVKVLRKNLFLYCDALQTIRIGKGVTKIEENVFFWRDDRPRTIYFPDNITDFANCLTTYDTDFVYVRRNSKTAAYFYETGYPFTDPDYPEAVVCYYREDESELDGYLMAVKRMTETAEPVLPPETKILHTGFYRNSQLTQITVPEGIVKLEGNVFDSSQKLVKVHLPSTLRMMGTAVFQNCAALKEVNFPSGLRRIPQYTFKGCRSLQQIAIPASVTEIMYQAFSSTGVRKVYIPGTVTTIEDDNFSSATVYCYSGTAAQAFCQRDPLIYDHNITLVLLDQEQRVALPANLSRVRKKAMMGTTGQIYSVPKKVTVIENLAFANIAGSPVFIIPSSVTQIADDAFSGTSAIILAQPGSAAANYANSKGLTLVPGYGI